MKKHTISFLAFPPACLLRWCKIPLPLLVALFQILFWAGSALPPVLAASPDSAAPFALPETAAASLESHETYCKCPSCPGGARCCCHTAKSPSMTERACLTARCSDTAPAQVSHALYQPFVFPVVASFVTPTVELPASADSTENIVCVSPFPAPVTPPPRFLS